MAVLPSYPGLTVEILVDGEPLPEYDGDEGDRAYDTKTTYVEARTNAEFSVRYTFEPGFMSPHLSVEVIVDGTTIGYVFCASKDLLRGATHTVVGRNFNIGDRAYVQKLRFSELAVVEGNRELLNEELKNRVASLGTIAFDVYHVKNIGEGRPSQQIEDRRVDAVPEEALKGSAQTHQTKLGNVEEGVVYKRLSGELVGEPIATFNFQYRSLDALKALQIVPRTPSPVPLEERPEEELSPAELLELGRDAAARRFKQEAGTKRERPIEVDAEDDEVTFVGSRNKKRRRGLDKGVIVLD